MPHLKNAGVVLPHSISDVFYDSTLFLWKTIINIFFREIRPRGAFHIPRDGPVILVAAPHHNQVKAKPTCSLLTVSLMGL